MKYLFLFVLALCAWPAAAQTPVDSDLSSGSRLESGQRAAGTVERICAAVPYGDVSCALELGRKAVRAGQLHKAVDILEAGLPLCAPPSPDCCALTVELAVAYQDIGRLPDAERTARQAVEMAATVYDRLHPKTIDALAFLGGILVDEGKLNAAENLLSSALGRMSAECVNSPRCSASTRNAIAGLALARGASQDAAVIWRSVLADVSALYGEDSLLTAPLLIDLAMVHRIEGRPERALPLVRRARFLLERQYGPQSTKLISVLETEATVALANKDGRGAERLFGAALAIIRQTQHPQGPDVTRLRLGLARAYRLQGKNDVAEREILDLLSAESRRSPDSVEMAAALFVLAELYGVTKRRQEALSYYDRAIALMEKHAAYKVLFREVLLHYAGYLRGSDRPKSRQMEVRANALVGR